MTPHILRDGSTTLDPRLDSIASEDPRCRRYRVDALFEPAWSVVPRRWSTPTPLDQGMGGACVGFAWAHALASAPIGRTGVDETFAMEHVYWNAQRCDPYPGGDYPGASPQMSGTSVLAGAEALLRLGLLREYRWADTIDALLIAVCHLGPVILGCRWYRGFDDPDRCGTVHATGPLMGRHSVLVFGVDALRDSHASPDELCVLIMNSRGLAWGAEGSARLPLPALRRVWEGSEACLGLPSAGGLDP